MSIIKFIKEEQFFHYFQPIYDLGNWTKIGFEGLIRSNLYHNPEHTFLEAKKVNQLYELDSRSIHKAILTYHRSGLRKKDGNLFLNVFPSTILNQSFPSFLTQIITENHLNSQQIVLEISESELIEDFDTFKIRIADLKKLGYLIAIDDFGKGYFNIKTIVELEPDYLKLDRFFAKDLHLSAKKQLFISYFLNYCNQYQSQMILEGIENEVEMMMAKSLGVSIAQGYLIGKPALLDDFKLI